MNINTKPHRLIVVPIICVFTIAIFLWAQTNIVDGLRVLPLSFNPYALLSFFAVIVNILLFIVVGNGKNRGTTARWYLLFLASLIIWGICEGMQRLSPHAGEAMFWAELAAVGVAFMPVAFLIFSLSYTANDEGLNLQPKTWVLILVSVAFMVHFNSGTNLITIRDISETQIGAWGFYGPNGPYFWAYLLWIEACLISSLYILVRHYFKSIDVTTRRQTLLFIISLLIPLVIGSITDGILPLFDITPLPTAILFTSVMSLLVFYGIHRYGLFNLNPVTVAENILSSMSEGVVVTNAQNIIQSTNSGMTNMLARKESGYVGVHISKLFSKIDYENLVAVMNAKFAHKHYVKIPETFVFASHGSTTVSLSVSKIEVNNEVVGLVYVFTDITELKRKQLELEQAKRSVEQKVRDRTVELRVSQARLEASINGLNSGFIVVDENNKLLIINAVAKSILTEASGKTVNFTKEWDMDTVKETSGGSLDLSQQITNVIRTRSPSESLGLNIGQKIINVFINPVTDSVEMVGCLIMLEDVTETKLLERSKDEFFSIASHELRTPLTIIRGNASMLVQDLKNKKEDTDTIESVNDIYNSSVRLISIVNDFLDLSRSEQGKIDYVFTDFSLYDLAAEVEHEMIEIAKLKGLYLRLGNKPEKEPTINADYKRTKQVVMNLISNAVNYTTNGGIDVGITTLEDHVELRVRDTGKGIAKSQQSLLFRKFQQAGESILTRETTKGTGLGLYISKKLTSDMNGTIGIESSEPGVGSVFIIKLPLAKQDKHHS